MSTPAPTQAEPVKRMTIPIPEDIYEILRNLAFDQRVTKQSLVLTAIRKVYGEQGK